MQEGCREDRWVSYHPLPYAEASSEEATSGLQLQGFDSAWKWSHRGPTASHILPAYIYIFVLVYTNQKVGLKGLREKVLWLIFLGPGGNHLVLRGNERIAASVKEVLEVPTKIIWSLLSCKNEHGATAVIAPCADACSRSTSAVCMDKPKTLTSRRIVCVVAPSFWPIKPLSRCRLFKWFYSRVSERGNNLLFSVEVADGKCEDGKQHSGARRAVWQTVAGSVQYVLHKDKEFRVLLRISWSLFCGTFGLFKKKTKKKKQKTLSAALCLMVEKMIWSPSQVSFLRFSSNNLLFCLSFCSAEWQSSIIDAYLC